MCYWLECEMNGHWLKLIRAIANMNIAKEGNHYVDLPLSIPPFLFPSFTCRTYPDYLYLGQRVSASKSILVL
jgi:hypothetical protein